AFVARRLESDPIVLLATIRDGYRSALADAGLADHRLDALGSVSAAELLDTSPRQLTTAERKRTLQDAAGNPLALIELPLALADRVQDEFEPGLLPLTERLERAFAARVSELPEQTRLLVLVAALDDGDQLGEVLHAGSLVAGTGLDLDLLVPAAEANVVELDLRTVRFRHPLVRSAVRQSASVPQRRSVHEALAETLEAEPDRQVWHRAALITGAHEGGAAGLQRARR